MVFHSLVEMTSTPPQKQKLPLSMASQKTFSSQQQKQLHNFALPDLKWSMNCPTNAGRVRKASDSKSAEGYVAGSKSEKAVKSEMKQKPPPAVGATEGGRAKLLIRIRAPQNFKLVEEEVDPVSVVEEAEGSLLKTWNLRPRKPMTINNNGNASGGAATLEIRAPQDPKLGGKAPAAKNEKEEKKKFSIVLTKEEIEEDFLAMTGGKPSKRPQKRTKSVQKQLDYTFPGLWLSSITPDSYKVNNDGGRSKF
ncbi:hypothetical protein ACOSP7_003582 [Xanthoceras sorbifolium]